jgi:hypothetical protein
VLLKTQKFLAKLFLGSVCVGFLSTFFYVMGWVVTLTVLLIILLAMLIALSIIILSSEEEDL